MSQVVFVFLENRLCSCKRTGAAEHKSCGPQAVVEGAPIVLPHSGRRRPAVVVLAGYIFTNVNN